MNAELKVLALQAEMREIIKEHRPGTLEQEMPALLNICSDAYCLGMEHARAIVTQNLDSFPTEMAERIGSGSGEGTISDFGG
jgi:hypothetical protein